MQLEGQPECGVVIVVLALLELRKADNRVGDQTRRWVGTAESMPTGPQARRSQGPAARTANAIILAPVPRSRDGRRHRGASLPLSQSIGLFHDQTA